MKLWSFSPVVAQLLGGLFAVVFSSMVMSCQITDRSSFANSELHQDVMERWGAPIRLAAPSVRTVASGSVFNTLESLPLESQEITVTAEMNYRKRGLVYFSGFDFSFNGRYLVVNDRAHEIDVAFVFPISFEKNKVLLSDLRFSADGEVEQIKLAGESEYLLWTGRLGVSEEVAFTIGFSGRGLDSFTYLPDPDVPVRNFELGVQISGGDNFDYAAGVIPATKTEVLKDGMAFSWQFASLESGVPVGVILPSEKSFDAIIATMARRSWPGFLLLFVLAHGVAIYSRRVIKVHEGLLFGAAYSFFFVLVPYLAAFMNFYVAYFASLAVIGLLLASYVQHVVGAADRRIVIGGLIASLVIPTLAVILEGYTGLIYTLEILVLLALTMWFTTLPAFRQVLAAVFAEKPEEGAGHVCA